MATAAGGAPTSALPVESESKHGGSEGLCRVLQIFSLVSAEGEAQVVRQGICHETVISVDFVRFLTVFCISNRQF